MIVPSLLAPTFAEIKSVTDKLRGHVPEIQVDMVDGKFVPATTWPFTDSGDVHETILALSELSRDFKLEVDCMVMSPEQYLDDLVKIGISKVVIHLGSTNNWDMILEHRKQHGYELGLGIMNDVNVEDIQDLIGQSDYVQVMGIDEIGKQGQPFSEATIDTIKQLKNTWPDLPVSVDGAVNKDTIGRLSEAGVERFAPGSAITKATDPVKAYEELVTLV